jgi:DNA-binding transcriptional MerR regulator
MVMEYTIKQIAEKTNLTPHTIRYYDKEGMLPFVRRNEAGIREFSDNDLEWIFLICCLKNTGMPIKQIKKFIDLCIVGDETLAIRRQMLLTHRKDTLRKISDLQKNLAKIDAKIEYYNRICKDQFELQDIKESAK